MKPANEPESDNQWRAALQASSAMTQELRGRNGWGWDRARSPGTRYTPTSRRHEGSSCGRQKDSGRMVRKGKEGEEQFEWVAKKKSGPLHKKLVRALAFASQGTYLTLFLLQALVQMTRT